MGVFSSCLVASGGSLALVVSKAVLRRTGYVGLTSYVYLLALFLSNSWFLSQVNFAHDFGKLKSFMNLGDGCSSNLIECEKGQIMYRASMTIFFIAIGLASLSTFMRSGCRGNWPLKTLFATVLLILLIFLAPNGIFNHWSSFARYLTLPWLIFQGLVVLDTAYSVHDSLNLKAERAEARGDNFLATLLRILYLCTCLSFLGVTIAMLVKLEQLNTDCNRNFGWGLVIFTVCWGIISTCISMTNSVGTGLLPPTAAFAYSTLLCWHYFPMTQQTETCKNSSLNDSGFASQILLYILFGTLARCTWHKGGVLGLLGVPAQAQIHSGPPIRIIPPQGYVSEEGLIEDASMCSVMALAGLALAMLSTNWADSDGVEQVANSGIGFWSVVISQIGVAVMHGLALWTSYREDITFAAYVQI